MITMGWFEGLFNTMADHGRELIGLKGAGDDENFTDASLCHRLVEGLGEASNVALAREILQRWSHKSEDEKLIFLQLLAQDFGLNVDAIEMAAQAYRSNDPKSLKRLVSLTEAPRQELIRRLNMAPNGTAVLVEMRAFLLKLLPDHPYLKDVDEDFQHLLSSWFNRGFLRLQRIDWNSSAAVLEKLIQYEAVHPMEGWDDLRRRLKKDRRCFAFFHPALPDVPLVFVEVALTSGISNSISTLIDPKAEVEENRRPDTAIFYSINNALMGLRGVSFGNFLIKQVAEELKLEFPSIETFATLSPIPLMRKGLIQFFDETNKEVPENIRAEFIQELNQLQGEGNENSSPLESIEKLIQSGDAEQSTSAQSLLQSLCLYYLTEMKRKSRAFDPVTHFHLSNGATLERINVMANTSNRGLQESWGCMVNYRYENSRVVANHEDYVCNGKIVLSKDLQRLHKQLISKLNQA